MNDDRPPLTVHLRRLAHAEGLPLPQAASAGSAGSDLRAAVGAPLTLAPGARCRVPTGLILEIPPGWEGQVRPRSGLAARHGVTLVNSPGTIDADYRGEIQVLMINLGAEEFIVQPGERIAQLIIAPVEAVRFEVVEDLSTTERGTSGFGSSGRD